MVGPAHASIVQGLELEELVAHADRIVLGRVLFSRVLSGVATVTIGTWHRIAVERELRGQAPDEQEVMVETLGSEVRSATSGCASKASPLSRSASV